MSQSNSPASVRMKMRFGRTESRLKEVARTFSKSRTAIENAIRNGECTHTRGQELLKLLREVRDEDMQFPWDQCRTMKNIVEPYVDGLYWGNVYK